MRLEAFARERGCRDALIETLSDRTGGLYERLDDRAVPRIPGCMGRFTKHVLVKSLDAQPPPA